MPPVCWASQTEYIAADLFSGIQRRKGAGVKRRLALERWPAGNANPAGSDDEERAALKRISVIIEYLIELVDLGLQGSAGKPEEDDAGVGEALLKDELAEIAVGNNQNPLLLPGNCQDILIGKTVWVVTGDSLNVMSERLQMGNQSEISALVKKEVHRVASGRVPLGGFGETSSPVTISFA